MISRFYSVKGFLDHTDYIRVDHWSRTVVAVSKTRKETVLIAGNPVLFDEKVKLYQSLCAEGTYLEVTE